MIQQKLNDYNLVGGIHTLTIRSKEKPREIDDSISNCIESFYTKTSKGISTHYCKINPNKLIGDLSCYSDFESVFKVIIDNLGLKDYEIIRTDAAFDNFNDDHYIKYSKLYRYLALLLSITYGPKNSYRVTDLFSQKQKSVVVKNRYFELECYDKFEESNRKSLVKSRFEERSKGFKNNDIKKEFVQHWFARWNKAISNIELLHQTINDKLEQIYLSGKNENPIQFRSLTDFLILYQNSIFCKQQMIDLLSRFDEVGPDKAKARAEYHKKTYGIEYFSKSNLKKAIKEIKRSTNVFFEN